MDNISAGTSIFDYLHNVATPSSSGKTQAWLEEQGRSRNQARKYDSKRTSWKRYFNELDTTEAEKCIKESHADQKRWEETARSIDEQAKRWMAQAEVERQAALREQQKTRRIQEEIRRAQENAGSRRTEKCHNKRDENIIHDEGVHSDIRRNKREKAAKKLTAAWNKYESRWRVLNSSTEEELAFRTIPWPLMNVPSSPSSISPKNISFFLLSDVHSKGKPKRERIREAMQRWHTDKFEPRILPRVIEGDRKSVKEGADIVVRCLNDLLSRETA